MGAVNRRHQVQRLIDFQTVYMASRGDKKSVTKYVDTLQKD